MVLKSGLRREIRARRNQLDSTFVADASLRIQNFLVAMEEFRLAERVGFYAPIRNEVNTQGVFLRSAELRKEAFFPRVNPSDKTIRYYRISRWEELSQGFAGIPEPVSQKALKDINDLHLLLIPGLAFDLKGNRLGWGDGYYDRLLATFRGKRVGLAYEFQMVDALPATPPY